MSRDPRGHRRRRRDTRPPGPRLRQRHAVMGRAEGPRQRAAPTGQRRQPRAPWRLEALARGGGAHAVAWRSVADRLDLCGWPLDDTALDCDHPPWLVAFDDWRAAQLGPRVQSGTAARAGGPRLAAGLAPGAPGAPGYAPSVGTAQESAGKAHAGTRSSRRRIRGTSQGARPSPASHKRVRTSMASALQTTPPGFLTRLASACTSPRSWGGSTRGSCTACPWRPVRAPPVRTRARSEAAGHHHGLEGTTLREQCDRKHHRLGGGAESRADRAGRLGAGLTARRADEPLGLVRVDADVPLAYSPPRRAGPMRAAYGGGVHACPPGFAWKRAKRSMAGPPFAFQVNLTTVKCVVTRYCHRRYNDHIPRQYSAF